jgi:monoterpene epsilon-lactone hydrolase
MASTQSKLFNILVRWINNKKMLRDRFASGSSGFFNSPKPPSKIRRTCNVREFHINGRNVFTLSPKTTPDNGRHILYLHGGAYVQNFIKFHWDLMAELVIKSGCTVTAPDYPLAPDHTYKESFNMLTALYYQLIRRVSPQDIIFMGDSSGGGFALALAQKMRNDHIAQPGQIILLSPWLDITLTNPDIKDVNGVEPFLGLEGLRKAGKLYAGDANPGHYLLSPINGALEGLGKISILIGSKDILVADTRKLRSLAESKGIKINYYEYEDMLHAWMFLNFPESKRAKQQIVDLIALPVSPPTQ